MVAMSPPPLGTCTVAASCIFLFLTNPFISLNDVSLLPLLIVPPHLQLHRLLSSSFYHASFFHILFNMLALFSLGSSLENRIGTVRFLSLSFVVAVVASVFYVAVCALFFTLFNDQTWMLYSAVGYSGVLFAYASIESLLPQAAPTRSFYGLFNVPTKYYPLLLILILQILMPNVSFLGHVSGLVVGIMQVKGLLYCLLPPQSWVVRAEDNGCLSFANRLSNFVRCPEVAVGSSSLGRSGSNRECPWSFSFSPRSGGIDGSNSSSVGRTSTADDPEKGYNWGSQGNKLGNGHDEKKSDVVHVQCIQQVNLDATDKEDDDDECEEGESEDARLLGVCEA